MKEPNWQGAYNLLDQVVGYLVCLDEPEFAEQRRVMTLDYLIRLAKDYRTLAAKEIGSSS